MMNDLQGTFLFGVFLAFISSGFFFSDDVNSLEIEKGYELCLSNGGLQKIRSYVFSDTFVCNNGAEFSMDLDQIKKKK